MTLWRRLVGVLALCVASLMPGWVLGVEIIDPKPPLSWDELLSCQVIVVAKYKSHERRTLCLEATQVLKGERVRAGDLLPVALEHWYSIETEPFSWEAAVHKALGLQPDRRPALCYKQQLSNPGGLLPIRHVPDIHGEIIYFFPQAKGLRLERKNQVQDARWVEGWRQAIENRPMSLYFRVMQGENAELAKDSLAELRRTRDRETLEQLWLGFLEELKGMRESFGAFQSHERVLIFIGDRNGDLYSRAWKQLDGELVSVAHVVRRSVDQHVERLGSPSDAERESAIRALSEIGWPALAALERAAHAPRNEEQRRLAVDVIHALKKERHGSPLRYRLATLTALLAQIDRDRAWQDFCQLLKRETPFKTAVAENLHYFGDERALSLSFDLLNSPELVDHAMKSIRRLLRPWDIGDQDPTLDHLRKLALPKLKAAVKSPGLTKEQRRSLRECLKNL